MRAIPLLVALPLLGAAVTSHGQSPVRVGHVDERLVAVGDATQSYAQFLPAGYSAERRWPVLFVLDPRGRGLHALHLFTAAADRLGFVVLSSYNSLSDGPREPNVMAMNAMLASSEARLSIDPRRLYLAGFSGTARVVWDFALELRGHVAGVIGVGAGISFVANGPELTFAGDSSFAYFGGSGAEDFNYYEVQALAERLRVARVPSRVVTYPGPHDWPPAWVCARALEWLETRAMLGGRRVADSAWLRQHAMADLDSARRLESSGRLALAQELYDAVARDYRGMSEASDAARRAAVLYREPIVVRHRERDRALANDDQRQAEELRRVLGWADRQPGGPDSASLLARLRVASLREQSGSTDSLESAAARRILARIAVFLGFYAPRAYLERGAPDRALVMLRSAAAIAPLRGESCELLARARLMAGTPAGDGAGLCATPTRASPPASEKVRRLDRDGDGNARLALAFGERPCLAQPRVESHPVRGVDL
jgi:predicted esterase